MSDQPATIVCLKGDQTGQELLDQALRLINSDVLGFPLNLEYHDLSLEERRRTDNAVVHDAARAIMDHGFGLKAATITPEDAGDVGSPNAILRKETGSEVIVRTGRRIAGVRPAAGIHAPISVVRMAVDGAYGAKEWREGDGTDEVAWRTTTISRRVCRAVAEFSFVQATKMNAQVVGGPKWTVSPVFEGMLKEEMDRAAERHPGVKYQPILIDAMFAKLIDHSGTALVVPTLNRDGDLMSDMVMQLFGSIAGAESILLNLDDDTMVPKAVMAEAPHGTAPTLEGKDVANPLAMFLAGAGVLGYMKSDSAQRASRAIYISALEAVAEGIRTPDLGGHAGTTEFTDEVIGRVRTKLDVFDALGDSATTSVT